MLLSYIFGNQTAGRIFLHLFHYGELHASAIATDYGISPSVVVHQLNKLENAGLLVSKAVGRARVYQFNPKSPFTKPLKKLVETFYNTMSIEEREKLFSNRRRPRRKGKPVL